MAVINNVTVNIHVYIFLGTPVFNSLGCISRSGVAGPYGNSMFNLLSKCQTVFQSSCTIYNPTSSVWGFQFLHILSNTCCYLSFLLLPSLCYKVVIHCGFVFHFSDDIKDVEHLFMCLLSICIFSLVKCLLRSFAHFYIGLLAFLLLSCKSSLDSVDSSFLFARYMTCKYCLSLCGLSFHFSGGTLWSTRTFTIEKSSLAFFSSLYFRCHIYEDFA